MQGVRKEGFFMKKKQNNVVEYNKWGYIFLIPFVVIYLIFSFVPLITTFINSLYESYMSGLTQVGPNFVGFDNFKKLLGTPDIWIYAKNTGILWIMGFIPQIILASLARFVKTFIAVGKRGHTPYKRRQRRRNKISMEKLQNLKNSSIGTKNVEKNSE